MVLGKTPLAQPKKRIKHYTTFWALPFNKDCKCGGKAIVKHEEAKAIDDLN